MGGGVPGTGAEIFLQPMMQGIMKQIVLLERMEVCRREAQIYLQPVEEPHVGPGPGRTFGSVERRFPGRTCDLTGDPL